MIINPENLYNEAERKYQNAVDFYTGSLGLAAGHVVPAIFYEGNTKHNIILTLMHNGRNLTEV
jgi:hypothetical protein